MLGVARSATCSGRARARRIPGPHSAWFWDAAQAGGGPIVDLGCHCIEIIRSYMGKENRPIEVMCWTDTLIHPIEAEDNAIALTGEKRRDRPVRGQLDVPRRHGRPRRGGRQRGTIWSEPLPATRLRGLHSPVRAAVTLPRRPRARAAGSSRSATRSRELGFVDMFTDMFDALDAGRAPTETLLRRLRGERDHRCVLSLG